ncbi:hypothetical protein TNCT_77471 [Trichonephila clavata]|uniref:Uncharacterized protein n=1 Tax=Trichonephila clavata TaxID=2740835 RepID=A0A8X6I3W7_TRICU|nr:hypothetical protein TNCT_77471 [Trichonephila clavata]
MDESIKATDTSQAGLFMYKNDGYLKIVEDCVIALRSTTRGKDLYSSLTQTLKKYDFSNLSATWFEIYDWIGSISTLLQSNGKASGNNTLTFHCIIRKENTSEKSFPCDDCCIKSDQLHSV